MQRGLILRSGRECLTCTRHKKQIWHLGDSKQLKARQNSYAVHGEVQTHVFAIQRCLREGERRRYRLHQVCRRYWNQPVQQPVNVKLALMPRGRFPRGEENRRIPEIYPVEGDGYLDSRVLEVCCDPRSCTSDLLCRVVERG